MVSNYGNKFTNYKVINYYIWRDTIRYDTVEINVRSKDDEMASLI